MALTNYNIKLFLISPKLLKMPEYYLQYIEKRGIKYKETENIFEFGQSLDVLYVTRIQRERFGDPQEYEKVAGSYKVNLQALEKLGKDVRIMHPLPRVDEIDPAVDETDNAIYFEQAHNGIPVRQAILSLVTGVIQ